VIPESLLSNPQKMTETIVALGLPLSFDVRGYENLAPSCVPCNRDKADNILAPGYINIILAKIAGRIDKIKEILEKKKAAQTLDTILRNISKSLDAKVFTEEDFQKGLRSILRFSDRIRGSKLPNYLHSPEQRISKIYIENLPQVRLAKTAVDAMESRGIDTRKLSEKIIKAVAADDVFALALSRNRLGPVYELRLKDMRIVFAKNEDVITVVSLFSKDSATTAAAPA